MATWANTSISLIYFITFISFANLILNKHTHKLTHTESKDINDTIQARTPQQFAATIADPEHGLEFCEAPTNPVVAHYANIPKCEKHG